MARLEIYYNMERPEKHDARLIIFNVYSGLDSNN